MKELGLLDAKIDGKLRMVAATGLTHGCATTSKRLPEVAGNPMTAATLKG
jgi:hypothetical protein